MDLLVKVGNTTLQIAYYKNNNIVEEKYFVNEITCEYNLQNIFDKFLQYNNINEVNKVVIISVLNRLNRILIEYILKKISKNIKILNYDERYKLDFSSYKNETLGLDRILCCESAINKYNEALIVIDLGTATTINVVNNKNVFIGGMIICGLSTSLECLFNKTNLPRLELEKPKEILGLDTVDSITSGTIYGTVSMIEGLVTKIANDTKTNYKVIVTGGNAKYIIDYLDKSYIYQPNLLLEGLLLFI